MNLTPFELDIFMELQEYGSASFEQLEAIAWSYCRFGMSNRGVVRSVVCKLRRKVEPQGYRIQNERGWGYRLRGPK